MRRREWFLQDENGGGEGGSGGGGGGNTVDAAAARTFLNDFAHDPEAVKAMPDDQVVAWHGRVTAGIDKVRPAGGKWPDNWRQELAEDFEKEKDQLGRYQSPKDIWKKARALEQKLSSGEYKRAVEFPAKGTPEEQSAWRKEQGIPETHDKYELGLPEGLHIGDADKPLVDDFLKAAHADNMPPAAVKRAVNWFFQNKEKQIAAVKEETTKVQTETEEALRNEWGGDFRRNMSVLEGHFAETIGDEKLRADLMQAAKLNPEFAKRELGIALLLNPASTILPNTGGNTVQAISDEIASLKKMMGDQSSAYWKGPDAAKNQERYRQLVDAQKRMEKKAA